MTDRSADSQPEQNPDLGLDGFEHPSDDEGLSLDELSQAYVSLLDEGSDPYQTQPDAAPEASISEATAQLDDESLALDEPQSRDVTPLNILEAMLFVGTPDNSPLETKKIAAQMRGVRPQEVEQMVTELNEAYDAEGCPYRIISAGPGFQMVLRDEFSSLRNRFYGKVKDAKLSQAAIDVLAIVAYNQPVTRTEIDELRGKPSGGLLNQLVRRQLLQIERSEEKPRIANYLTTTRFLRLFHLETLDDLPRSQDLDRLV